MRLTSKILTSAAFAMLVATAPLHAQTEGNPQGSAEVSDTKLEQFSEAFGQIQDIRSDYSEKLRDVQDEEKAREMQQAANDEMISAVEDSGLSVDEYNAISQQLRKDPEMAERVQGMIE
ncbi:DUF4168 domain-containing protein [Arhodomonas sp. AD133]|uniref:DUF4168 domain-containing protein n=1 Tax=Arhodomonas sp. AD133 TaxID=3415009 RepID=UPI003EBDEBFC